MHNFGCRSQLRSQSALRTNMLWCVEWELEMQQFTCRGECSHLQWRTYTGTSLCRFSVHKINKLILLSYCSYCWMSLSPCKRFLECVEKTKSKLIQVPMTGQMH